MDRRQFLALSAGLSAIASNPVAAALSLDEVRSGMKVNRGGEVEGKGFDFLKYEKRLSDEYLYYFPREGFNRGEAGILHYFNDVGAQQALQSIYLPLTQSSTRSNLQWKVMLADSSQLKWGRINASTPGGGITIMHSDLIKYCNTEAELVSVLAHEIGHIEHKHAIRRLMADEVLRQFGINNRKALIKQADEIKSKGGDIGISDMMEISLEIFYKNFTRMFEHQADAMILKVFVEHGYDLKLANQFNKIMIKKFGDRSPNLCIYSTHPAQVERMARIGAIAETLTPTHRPKGDSDAFRYLKNKIGHVNV